MRKRAKNIIRLLDNAVDAEKRYDFQNAKQYYKKIVSLHPCSPEADIARERMEDMDALSSEKRIYKRIDRNAKRVLTEIGIDISGSPELMQILTFRGDSGDLATLLNVLEEIRLKCRHLALP